MISSPKVGQTVVIKSNLAPVLRKQPKPVLGVVTSVNGFYVMVQPFGHDWTAEYYCNELAEYKPME